MLPLFRYRLDSTLRFFFTHTRICFHDQKMLKSTFSCCKVYISETRNKSALNSIEQAAKLFPEAAIVNKFQDETYNRVGYTLVSKSSPNSSPDSPPLKHAVFSMVKAAFEAIDFGLHSGTHPRLGVVDHICFHPLASSSLEDLAGTAKSLASDIGSILKVPTYTYGAAHNTQRSLDSIRRALGYFNPTTTTHHWSGAPQSTTLALEPDHGPAQVVQSKGVVTIGATKWVDNYNVPVFSDNMAKVRRIAKRVSGRGGGLAGVQSMALAHGEVIEVACNLLDPGAVGGDRVQREVERVGLEEGVGCFYSTTRDPYPMRSGSDPASFSTGFVRFFWWVLDFFHSVFFTSTLRSCPFSGVQVFRQQSDQPDKNPLRHRCLPLSVVSRAASTPLHPELLCLFDAGGNANLVEHLIVSGPPHTPQKTINNGKQHLPLLSTSTPVSPKVNQIFNRPKVLRRRLTPRGPEPVHVQLSNQNKV
ncbi:hypothetical protein LXL04_019873 [Taraxacum kok-saghyz]